MVWSDENKEHFVLLLRDNKDLLFGDWSPSVTKAARNRKWTEIASEMTARGAVFKDIRSLRKVTSSLLFIEILNLLIELFSNLENF